MGPPIMFVEKIARKLIVNNDGKFWGVGPPFDLFLQFFVDLAMREVVQNVQEVFGECFGRGFGVF